MAIKNCSRKESDEMGASDITCQAQLRPCVSMMRSSEAICHFCQMEIAGKVWIRLRIPWAGAPLELTSAGM